MMIDEFIIKTLFFPFNSLNDAEIRQLLMESDSEDNTGDRVTVTIEPPNEEPTAITDCDSDKSDDEVTCNPDHLPRRIGKSTKIFTFSDFPNFFYGDIFSGFL